MNTTKHGMRAIVASAAAGALVLGSAAGTATAKPHTPKGPKAAYLQATKVDLHRHSPVNVFTGDPAVSSDDATARDVTIRATVRDRATTPGADPVSVTVTVSQYSGKHGTAVVPGFTRTVPLALKRAKHHEKTYTGTITGAELRAGFSALPVGSWAYVCIADLTVTPPEAVTVLPDKRRVTKKENGGDCVKVINVDPAATRSPKDDPAPVTPTP